MPQVVVMMTSFCFLFSSALTSVEIVVAKEESNAATVASVVSVVAAVVIIAAVMGLFLYRRRNTLRVKQQSHQSHPAGYIHLELFLS